MLAIAAIRNTHLGALQEAAMSNADQLETWLWLLLALGLGAAIGLERERRGHEAGIRTTALVCVGAALFGQVSLACFGPNLPPRPGCRHRPGFVAVRVGGSGKRERTMTARAEFARIEREGDSEMRASNAASPAAVSAGPDSRAGRLRGQRLALLLPRGA